NGEFTDDSKTLVVCLSNGSVRTWTREEQGWDVPAKEVLKESKGGAVVTDSRGLHAIVGKPSLSPGTISDPPQLFDLSKPDDLRPKRIIDFDFSVDWQKYLQVDKRKQWLLAICKNPSDGVRVWNLRGGNDLIPRKLTPPEGVVEAKLSP